MRTIVKLTAKDNYTIQFTYGTIWSNPWDYDNAPEELKPKTPVESISNYRDWLTGARFVDFMQRERALQLINASLLGRDVIIAADQTIYAKTLLDVIDSGMKLPEFKEEWVLKTDKKETKKEKELKKSIKKGLEFDELF